VLYPNLPVRLDLNSVIFPLEGETFCTGLEFVLAMKLDCELEILGGVYIPFKHSKKLGEDLKNETGQVEIKEFKEVKEVFIKDPHINQLEILMETQIRNQLFNTEKEQEQEQEKELLNGKNDDSSGRCLQSMKNENENENENENVKIEDVKNSSFYSTVKELMLERLKYPKGSYMNLLYKFLANAGIGQMARGLNQKVRYDSQTNSTKVLPSGDLVSPLYAG